VGQKGSAPLSHYSTYSDAQLVALLKADDHKAFTELYNRYWEQLYAMAYARLKDGAQAEDIVHDVFVSLWQRREAVRIVAFRPWLATAVKYSIIRTVNRTTLFRKYSNEQAAAVLMGGNGLSPAEELELSRLLAEAIERLPERCRLVFRLRQEGMSNTEIAEAMDTSLKTVQNQVNRGLRVLRTALKHYLFF
jgi:RNA polymerase sigma-70 factor (family 1)